MKKFRSIICLLIMSMLVSCSNGADQPAQPTTAPTEAVSNNTETSNSDKEQNSPAITETPEVKPTDENEAGTDTTGNTTAETEGKKDIPAAPAPGVVSVTKKAAVAGDLKGTEEAVTNANKSGESNYKVIDVEFKKKDTDVSLKEGEVKTITFTEDSATLDCPGAKVENVDGRTVVTIMMKGSYVLTGSCANGQVVVDSDENENVHLYLNGLDLNCNGSAAIYEKQCDKLIVTLVNGSVNNITETGELVYENVEKEEPDAVLFAKDKAVINGEGELNVIAENGQGICSTDDLILVSGNINVQAASHGIKGKDSVVINSGNININAGEDGLKSSSSKEAKGYMVILGGDIKISAAQDGIQTEGELQLTGGSISVYTGGGRTADTKPDSSCKGIKAGRDIYINGAALQVNASEVALKSDKQVIIDNGNIILASGTKGIQAKYVTIYDGIMNIDSSKEGIEGKSVTFQNGTTVIYSKNDGVSAVDAEVPENTDGVGIAVNGGILYINASTDGLDSKGNLVVNDGTVMIDGPAKDGNSAIDYKAGGSINGGNFVGLAASANVVNFDDKSSQNILEVYFGEEIKAGAEIKVASSDQNIISFKNAKNCSVAIISCAEFKSGETYTVTVDGVEVASVKVTSTITKSGK